jgi:aquaporin Z
MLTKQRVASLVAEFFGTAILALAVLAVATSQIGLGYFVAFGAGLALVLLVLSIGSVSGAVVNPALTIGLWTIRQISTLRAAAYLVVQLLGGVAAFGLFGYLTGNDTWTNRSQGFDSQLLVAEVIGTAIFAFGVAAAYFQRLSGTNKALLIGGSFSLGIIVASIASAAFLNPAVALAGQTWEWGTYVLGPVLGAIIGINLYSLLFAASVGNFALPGLGGSRPSAVSRFRARRDRTNASTTVTTAKPVKTVKTTKAVKKPVRAKK